MRASLTVLLGVLVIYLLLSVYVYIQIKHRGEQRWLRWAYGVVCSVMAALMIAAVVVPARSGSNSGLLAKMWLLYGSITLFIPQVLAVLFDAAASLPRLWRGRRWRFLFWTGIVLGAAVFVMMWWGALVNRFRIDVKEVEVELPGLPAEFDGYRMVQFSDMHVGTFGNDTTFVSEFVGRINGLEPDVILFTGDIVNRSTDEIYPFVPVFSRLHAPDGVYAILGNHDYGDYMYWESPREKHLNMLRLYDAMERAGFDLLLNRTAYLHQGADSIALIGVENIGDAPFPVYGSLAQAYPDLGDAMPKILLTHNPAHWEDSISGHGELNVPLTLSGHTHAMQIELGGVSPGVLRYRTWGGMYSDADGSHKLYVNIGAGTVGLPMRIGATPEITVLTLRSPDKIHL